jgi:hypothetical protein
MWKILMLPAIDDKAISFELKFVHEALYGGI